MKIFDITIMTATLYEIYIHIIFSTYDGQKLIPKELIPNLHGYIAKILANEQCHDICVGGISNHVHILTSLPKNIILSKLIKDIKLATNKLLNKQLDVGKFAWQKGYAVFSISPQLVKKVKKYIKNQEKHHIQTSYEKELKYLEMLCNRLDI